MTKKELTKMNKQAALEKLHATEEWQESVQLEEDCERAFERGDIKTARLLAGRCERMRARARKKMKMQAE